jgi:hypothetical protein
MELLVAGVISLIAASGMVIVMANTLGSGTKTIQMARLTQDMRTAMQIMTRELRRANYHSTFLSCYGNVGCLGSGAGNLNIAGKIRPIQIGDSEDTDDCLWFFYDRPQKTLAASSVAGFRRVEDPDVGDGTVGKIQMTTARTSDAVCNENHDADDWADITDPDNIDILTFSVDDSVSFTETINATGDTQSVEKIGLTMTARLTVDGSVPTWIQNNANANRQLTEFITVRNNTTTKASP